MLKKILKKLIKNRNEYKNRIYESVVKSKSAIVNVTNYYTTNNYLSKLCEIYGTDKGFVELQKDKPYNWEPHPYSVFYHTLFGHCRESIRLVFECGVGTNDINFESNMTSAGKPGASLKMWRDYFKNAEIFGADIDTKVLFQEDRIKTFEVNQLNEDSIKQMWKNIDKYNFDLIIDDGLHSHDASLNFFLHSYKKLKKGGLYIIEDVDYKYINKLENSLKKFNPEISMFDNKLSTAKNLTNNNLIIIRKE
jgi:SAM-dependent methyltransferase